MTVDRSTGPRTEGAIQETAQALVKRGQAVAAVQLLDRYLAQFDADWGMWLYFAGLCARVGKKEAAIAAYRACARQLEGDGHFERAREALRSALELDPRDEALAREVAQVVDPQATCLMLPVLEAKPLPAPAVHLTAIIPGRAKRRAPPQPPEVTDPHCPIFDFLDAERAQPLPARAGRGRP